jgi:hypothetical protein
MEGASKAVRAYTLMFRTGAVEVAASIANANQRGERLLSLTWVEDCVIGGWHRYMAFAKSFGIAAPFYVFLSVLNVQGFEPSVSFFTSASPVPSRRDSILLPEVEIAPDRLTMGPEVIFKRTFYTLANAFGLMRSSNPAIPRQ